MTVSVKKVEFLKAIREQVKTTAKAGGIRLSKDALAEIVLQQATDAINGTSARVLNQRLRQLLQMC